MSHRRNVRFWWQAEYLYTEEISPGATRLEQLPLAIREQRAHCCLSCFSFCRRGPVRRLYSFMPPTRIAFLRWSIMDSVVWDVHGFSPCMRGPRTSRAAVSKADLPSVHRFSADCASAVTSSSDWEQSRRRISLLLASIEQTNLEWSVYFDADWPS